MTSMDLRRINRTARGRTFTRVVTGKGKTTRNCKVIECLQGRDATGAHSKTSGEGSLRSSKTSTKTVKKIFIETHIRDVILVNLKYVTANHKCVNNI